MEYIKTGKYFAQVAGSLEAHAKAELEELGAQVLQSVPRGLRFACDPATLYRVIYCSRLAQRILAPLVSFRCHSEKYLYDQARAAVDWPALFNVEQSFGIESNVSASKISHSLYAGQLLKDAICDSFRDKYNRRPDFMSSGADINFNLHIRENWASISLDLTGSMHKRGYRLSPAPAPLQETLAAAIIRLSGWNGGRPLHDPMCGSGTLLCEALMHYCRIPAGFMRGIQGLKFLPDFRPDLWERTREQAQTDIRELPRGLTSGSDISAAAVQATRENLQRLPGGDRVEISQAPFQTLPRQQGRCIITNPPYGVRLEKDRPIAMLYHELGDFLKQKCPDSEAYILCGSKELVPELRLRAHWKKNLKNGDLEVSLAKILVKAAPKGGDVRVRL